MKAVTMAYVPSIMHAVEPHVQYVCVYVWSCVRMCWCEHVSVIWMFVSGQTVIARGRQEENMANVWLNISKLTYYHHGE